MTIQDISLRTLSGAKGDQAKNTRDNLFSTDIVEVLLGISEGPIKGLVDGAKSFYIGETQLVDQNGENNFDNFELVSYKGSEVGENIYSRMGGFGSSTTVSTELGTDIAVVRSGQHTDIDYLDVRFVINRLVKSDKKGTFKHNGRWTIEYKLTSAANWTPVRTPEINPLPTQISGESFDIFYGADDDAKRKVTASPGDRPTFWSSTQPISTANAAIWFNTSNNYKPMIFDGTTWAFPAGLVFTGASWIWSEASSWGADKATRGFVGATLSKTITFEQGDYWLNTTQGRALFYNGTTWIEAGSSLRPGAFGESNVTVIDGEISITDKTTTAFVKEFRIPVAQAPEPYMIRVKKTSPENTTERFFDITWESFQEVTAKAYNFPAVASTQLMARASEQFSSVPDFSGIYDGRIIRVPTNYNPETRVYTGIWDGLWKLAYSNNPAFVANDIVLNDRYGINAYYPVQLNKWDVYEAAQWCDTRAASGKPRFTFNNLISDPRGGRDAVNFICGLFAGRFFDDGNGTGVIKVDKDEPASIVFTPENVADGIFTYSFTEISTRHNDLTVTFINPDLNWSEDRRRLHDQDHIDQYGRIPFNFIAVGCTDVDEALLRARHHLVTATRETMLVNFKTNRLGLYLAPYEAILVADEDMGTGVTGRVQSVTGARSLALRDAIYLEPGFSYRVNFQTISEATNEFIIESRNLTAGTIGAVTTLNVTADLPPLPADATFVIEQTNGSAAPVAYRVMSINEIDGDPDNVDIQAVQMYRAKWLYIDGVIGSPAELDAYVLNSKAKPLPVPTVRVRPAVRTVGIRKVTTLTLDWDKSPTKTVTQYKIEGSRNNGPMSTLATTSVQQFEWDDIPVGEYVFQVTAIDVNGYSSTAKIVEHRLIGDFVVVDEITSIRMLDEPSETEFESRSPVFQWPESQNLNHEEYVVRITTTGDVLIREELITANTYSYEYAVNESDGAGTPRRAFKIGVSSSDNFGFRSEFIWLTVNNPAPPVPTSAAVDLNFGAAIIKYDVPPLRDFRGVMIHSSTEDGFTPTQANLVYKGPNNNVALVRAPGAIHYFKLALYDVFDDGSLNFGNQLSLYVSASTSDSDIVPPAAPTNLVLTPGVGFLLAAWTNPVDTDLEFVELFYNTVNNSATSKFGASSRGTSVVIPGMPHGVPVFAWARSVDRSGNRSGFVAPAGGAAAPTLVIADIIADAAIGVRHLQDQIVDTTHIVNDAITAAQIAANAVTATELASLAVTARNVAANAITTAAIVANAITAAQIAANAVTATQLADLAVTNAHLTANAVTAAKLADAAVAAGKIAANAVTGAELAALAVNSTKLADNAVTTAKIAANAVTANEIAANAITAIKILANTITGAKIAANTITGNEIAANTITAAQISAGAIGATEIAAKAVTAEKIAANTITAAQIAANTITAAQIAANTITAAQIAANAVTANEIAANTITAAQLLANTITGAKIAANTITGNEIAANTITAAQIAANTITAAQIAANTITSNEIGANMITAKHLVLDDGTNLIQNGSFGDITKDAMDALWTFGGGAYVQSSSASQAAACFRYAAGTAWVQTGQASLVIDQLTVGAGLSMYMNSKATIPVTAGDVLAWETELRSDVAANAGFYFRIYWYDANGAALTTPASVDVLSNVAVTTTFTIRSGQTTVPAAACFCRVRLYNHNTNTTARYFVIDRVGLRRANAASLIVNGTIVAAKIAANTITAAQIAANTITAAKIAANTITGNEISVANLAAISATLGAVNISSANIGTLTVGTSNIAAGAVTDVESYYASSSLAWSSSVVQVASITVTVAANEKVILLGSADIILSSSMKMPVTGRMYRNNVAFGMANGNLTPISVTTRSNETGAETYTYGWLTPGQTVTILNHDTPGAGTFTYTMKFTRGTQGTQVGSSVQRFLCALICKR
ncbi:TipJ family phage tail tip protein [Rhizobium arsenicireducens]